jgi:tRNA pseudouridine13 synthase
VSSNEQPLTPAIPPIVTAELPGTGGTIGAEPEDFVVDEVPLYAPSGTGEHLYIQIRKRNLTTRDAIRTIASASGVPAPEIGSAGMKDKHAVTTQWLSLPARRARPVEEWRLPPELSVEQVSRHGNKLRTGHLEGNHFRIRIVGTDPDAPARAARIVEHIERHGLPNCFGAQRFGREGRNLPDSLVWLEGEATGQQRRRLPPFERKLFASVVQSEVFNRYATSRIAEGLERPLAGEVVRLAGSGATFRVEDEASEYPRWSTRDILPTGPMVGPKMRAATGRPLELEHAAMASVGLEGDALVSALGRYADGTRRDVLVWPKGLTLTPERGAGESASALVLAFFLPSGSYATEVVRAFTREPFFRYTA